MQPASSLTFFSTDDRSHTDLSLDCGLTSQQLTAIDSPDDFEACHRVPHYWSPALRAKPVNQPDFYSPIDPVQFSSQQLSSSHSPQLHRWMVNAPGGDDYGETTMTSRRAHPTDFVWSLPSSSGTLHWRLQYDVRQLRILSPFTVWHCPFSLTTRLQPSVMPSWDLLFAYWLRCLHGSPPTSAVANRAVSPFSPYYIISQTSVLGIQLTPRIDSGHSIEDSLRNLIAAINDGFSGGWGAFMEAIIHFEPATSYLLPTSSTGSHRTAMGNHCVYVPREKAKQIADEAKTDLFFFVKEYPTIDEGTSTFLKKLARAVKCHRSPRVVMITMKTPSLDDLRRVNDLFGIVGFAYYQFFY